MLTRRYAEGLGTITLRRSRRARRFGIRVTLFDGVVVTVPWFASYASAMEAVERNRQWILRERGRIEEQEQHHFGRVTPGGCITRAHRLFVEQDDIEHTTVRIHAGVIAVRYPRTLHLDSTTVRRAIQSGILAAYRIEARAYLPGRVRELAERHGFSYRVLFIKNLRSRWGSCSVVNNINLALQLMRLPDELVDYVILHELVHTKVKNHGANFWRALDQVTGDAKGLDKRLRKERLWE
jgi:predicted metal-dependent hydrolase